MNTLSIQPLNPDLDAKTPHRADSVVRGLARPFPLCGSASLGLEQGGKLSLKFLLPSVHPDGQHTLFPGNLMDGFDAL